MQSEKQGAQSMCVIMVCIFLMDKMIFQKKFVRKKIYFLSSIDIEMYPKL